MLRNRVIARMQCLATATGLALALALGIVSAGAHAAPATATNLKLTPEASHVAIALPDLQALVDQIKALDLRMNPDGSGISGDIDGMIRDIANGAGAWGASDFNAIGESRGLDASQGLALFVDLSPSIASLLEQLVLHSAEQEDAEDGEEAELDLELSDAAIPLLAAVLTVKDEERVKESLEELINVTPDLASVDEEEKTVGDVTVKIYGEYAYFIHGGKVVLGHTPMVEGAAERVASPAPVRYGSGDAPVQLTHEAVALVYGDKFLPGLKEALPHLDFGGDARPFIETQVASLESMFEASTSSDPLIVTVGLSDEKVQIDLRLDTEHHPGVKAVSGEATPLRLAQFLPENTLAMLSLRFNEQSRKQLMDSYVPTIAGLAGQSADPQQLMIANQVVGMIGDELTLGIAGSRDDFPSIFLMIGLKDPEPTKGLLSMFIPTMPGETHKDVEIKSVAAPIPVPISLAFPGDMLLLSNSVEGMKGVIDLVEAGETSTMFSKRNLDPATPRYNTLMLDSQLFTDVVLPISSLTGGLPPEAESIATGLTPVVDEIRLVNEMQGSWSVTQLSVALHPAPAVDEEEAE